jgi:hypothetical protein
MNKTSRALFLAGTSWLGVLTLEAAPLPGMPPAAPPTGTAPGSATTPAAGGATALGAAKTTPSPYSSYSYYGERYRDPFVPLLGEVRNDSALDRPPQIASLVLKGIVQDQNGRMALLVSGVSSYILRGGRLYDGRNRMVKKISGVIKPDSVVLIGGDRTVRELRTRPTL